MANTKITSRVIADNAVTSSAIADGAITASKIASDAIDIVADTSPQLGGNLDVNGNAITGSTVQINGAGGDLMISATENGPVALRYDNNLKLTTKSDGVDITGELQSDSLDVDGDADISGTIALGNLTIAGAQGTDGQVLTSTGSGIAWEDVAGGPTFKTFGTSSIMIGDDATGTISGANYNTGVGDGVFAALTEGDENVMVGFAAGQSLTTGSYNIGIGVNAVDDCNTGNYNVGIGTAALGASTSGYFQTAIGHEALKNTNYTTNVYAYNTAVGYQAGVANTTGKITAIGAMVLASNTTGIMNVGVGGATDATGAALQANTTGNYNTAVGASSLRNNTEGYLNTAQGYLALGANTTGLQNCAVGANALYANTTGSNNVAIGYNAADACTTGSELVAIGPNALTKATTAVSCIAIGDRAFEELIDSPYNVAIGYKAGENFELGVSNEGSCTLVGDSAGRSITSGKQNTFIGAGAGYSQYATTTGFRNTVVGTGAHCNAGNGNLEVVLGFGVRGVGNGYTTIGSDINRTYNQQGSATWSGSSDERLKTDIVDEPLGLDFVNDLRPVKYKWKKKKDIDSSVFPNIYEEGSEERVQSSENGVDKHGFIAQELESTIANYPNIGDAGHEIFKQLDDGLYTAAPTALIPMLVKAIQELSAKVEELESQIGN